MSTAPLLKPASLPFRFDGRNHEYVALDTGESLPHITGMLEQTGWIDDLWFTEESSERGTAVHRLTADYDLGAIESVESVTSGFKVYLQAYVKALGILKAQSLEILGVEEPLVHPTFRFGGRPDRDIILGRARGVLEIKSGVAQKSLQIQTALQAVLISAEAKLPADALVRLCLYVTPKGKFKVERHVHRADFDEARRVIKECSR
jgi:hypothetical protein